MENILEENVLYINSERVIVNLLKADQKKYLSLPRLYRFIAFLRKQLENYNALSKDTIIVFDVNFDAIERTVYYNSQVYDLIGDKIFLKGVLPSTIEKNDFLSKAAREFSKLYAA